MKLKSSEDILLYLYFNLNVSCKVQAGIIQCSVSVVIKLRTRRFWVPIPVRLQDLPLFQNIVTGCSVGSGRSFRGVKAALAYCNTAYSNRTGTFVELPWISRLIWHCLGICLCQRAPTLAACALFFPINHLYHSSSFRAARSHAERIRLWGTSRHCL
jgi:hypothetical protein